MSLTCPVPSCARTMPGHLRVCRACSTELLRDLRDVPSLDRNLEEAATRQVRLGTPGGGPRSEEPLPWDDRARTAQQHLRVVLVGWVRVLQRGVRPLAGPACQDCAHRSCTYISLGRSPADTLPAMAVWLIRHRAVLLGHHAAPEAVDGIREAIRQGRRTIDRPADRIYAGPCNTCGADLLARPGARIVVCRPCSLEYDIGPRLEWMQRKVEDQLAHSVAMSGMLNQLGVIVPASTIRYFAQKKRITERGRDQNNRPLYRIGDVLEIVNAQKK